MKYLTLKSGYMGIVFIPIVILFIRIELFQAVYFKRKFEKIFVLTSNIFGFITTFVFYNFNYGYYFCFVWICHFILIPWIIILTARKIDKTEGIIQLDISDSQYYDLVLLFIDIILGIVVISIPYTYFFRSLSGDCTDSKILMLSKVIFTVIGLQYFILNKFILGLIVRRLKKRN